MTTAFAPTSPGELDQAVEELRLRADEFARLVPVAKAALARRSLEILRHVAPHWVAAGARAKSLTGNLVAEEWLAGPFPTARMLRLAAESWEAIADGSLTLGTGARTRDDGRLVVDVFPATGFERILYPGLRCHVVMEPGTSELEAQRRQASNYSVPEPPGGVSLVLGAGNVSSIPALDVFSRWLLDGRVCVLKMSPVNQWVGPFLEQVLAPFVEKGYLRVVYGDGEVGAALVSHPLVDDVHITGSDETHDLIVWGPPGPERARRIAAGEPLLAKRITSELGNISPVAIVPATYSEGDLHFQARNVATMVAQNGSFNCNAAKILITSRNWPQRERFMRLLSDMLARIPVHAAYYPGAFDRYEQLVGGRNGVDYLGEADSGCLSWAVVRDLDPADHDEDLFRVEPFCGIVSEVAIDPSHPDDFLEAATRFMNERLWGTLNATIVIPTGVARRHRPALEAAIDRLQYGIVAVNQWPAVAFGLITAPWGGHPETSLVDVQSGMGWVHNTYLLEGASKSVLSGPFRSRPDPVWFVDNPKALRAARAATMFETDPGWGSFIRTVAAGLA